MSVEGCEICSLAQSLKEAHLLKVVAPGWTLNRYQPRGMRPSLVLQTRTHRAELSDLSREEAHELSDLLPAITRVQQEMTGALRVHVEYRNETPPPHVHLQLIPRYANDPVAVRPGDPLPAEGADAAAATRVSDAALIDAIAERVRIRNPDASSPLLRGVVRIVGGVAHLSPYGLRPIRAIAAPARGEVYVAIWIAALASVLAIGSAVDWLPMFAISASLLAVLRYLDILSMHLRTVLVRSAGVLASARRSLILLFLNLVELALVQAIWVGATTRASMVDLVLNGGAVTAAATAARNWVPSIASAACSIATFILLGLGLANILALVAANFREVASGGQDD